MADGETASLWEKLSLGYTESDGHPLLRQAIAGLYERISPEQILVLAPEEAIFIAMHTLLQPGDKVIALFPAYQSLYELGQSIGCEVHLWRFQARADGWELDLDWLERSLDSKTRLLVINFPHNPTGYLPSRAELEAILHLADQHGVTVFSDEMYRLLEWDPARCLPAVCDLYERGISLSGMSKTFSLPGLRIGWLATSQPGLLERWQAFKDYTTICSSAPSEILALIGLRARQAIISRNLEIICSNLAYAAAFFDRHASIFRWLPPQAGSVAFPLWQGAGSVQNFCQRVLETQGVMIVPGSLFDYPGEHFRVGLGRRSFPEALERVERALAENKGVN
jgi:aspartate/methionine/tyrosine aminotransferase